MCVRKSEDCGGGGGGHKHQRDKKPGPHSCFFKLIKMPQLTMYLLSHCNFLNIFSSKILMQINFYVITLYNLYYNCNFLNIFSSEILNQF